MSSHALHTALSETNRLHEMNATNRDVSRSRSALGYDSPLRGRDAELSLSAYSAAGNLSHPPHSISIAPAD